MEFSFGPKKWVPKELLQEECDNCDSYALGLHAPGFFDKVLNVNKCLLQSEPANKVCFLSSEYYKARFLLTVAQFSFDVTDPVSLKSLRFNF